MTLQMLLNNENITKVEVVRPGFRNFYVNKKYLFDNKENDFFT